MRILFVGLGGAGQRHLRNFRGILGDTATYTAYRVRNAPAVIGPDFRLIEGSRIDIPAFDSLESALAGHPDAVVISNPTSGHVATALAAARAGAHVLIEKPLSNSMDGVTELEHSLTEQARVGVVGYMMRLHPALKQVRDWLNGRMIGRILSTRFEVASFVPEWHPWEDYRGLYAVNRSLGGGAVLTESHELDLALWFFGRPRKVFALGGSLTGQSGDVEDTASILLDFGFPVHVQLCFMQRPPSRSCEINGTEGRIVWEGGNTLKVFGCDGWTCRQFEGCEREELFQAEARHFLKCIEGQETPFADVPAGAAALEVALAALSSLATRQAVEL